MNHDPVQLVAKGHPVRLDVVWPPEQLDLSSARGESLYDAVYLVWLVTGGPHLGHYHVAVEAPVEELGVALCPHQAVLLAVVEPVPSPPRPDNSLELVGLHPDYFVHPLITPKLEALPS